MSKRYYDSVTLFGVPLDLGAENLGVDIGPQAFRYQDIVGKLNNVGFNVNDIGNVACKSREDLEPGDPRMHFLPEIVRVNAQAAEHTERALRKGDRVVALGGDHSINLGVVSGAGAVLKGQIGLIYLDAHGDMNTPETTLSGNIHGMHLAALMGFGPKELTALHGDFTKVPTDRLLHIGGSDFDPGELELIEKHDLQAFTLFDLLSKSMAPLLTMIDELTSKVEYIWVSLDLDVIDQIYAPGAGMPNAKGLTYREIAVIAEYIGRKCKVVGVDVVEYNPLQDEQSKTAELGIELIAKFFGSNYSWYTNYMAKNAIQSVDSRASA